MNRDKVITEEMAFVWDKNISQMLVYSGENQAHSITFWLSFWTKNFGFIPLFCSFAEQTIDVLGVYNNRQTLLDRFIEIKTDHFNKCLNHAWLTTKNAHASVDSFKLKIEWNQAHLVTVFTKVSVR